MNIYTDDFEYAVPESIELQNNEIAMFAGSETPVPQCIVYPLRASQEIVWIAEENNEVAEISDNKIRGIGVGQTVIRAYPANEPMGEVYGICNVEVLPVVAERISIDTSDLDLLVGKSYQFTAEILPENTTDKIVNWSSSNTSVAKVSTDGIVTGVAEGEAVITAKCGEATAECKVTVRREIIKGDSNWNGTVNIADAVNTANYAIGNPVDEFCFEASDINQDSRITISDAVGIITIVLDEPISAVRRKASSADYAAVDNGALAIDDFTIGIGESGIVNVSLEGANGYVALQADIIVPEGFVLEAVRSALPENGHMLMSRRIDERTMRIALFDPQISHLPCGATMLELAVSNRSARNGQIEITDIIASDESAHEFTLSARGGEAKDISGVGYEPVGNIRMDVNRDGITVFNAEGHVVAIHDLSGRLITAFEASTAEEICRLVPGAYVVTIANKNYKVLIKH